jgi:hypothetical protein
MYCCFSKELSENFTNYCSEGTLRTFGNYKRNPIVSVSNDIFRSRISIGSSNIPGMTRKYHPLKKGIPPAQRGHS